MLQQTRVAAVLDYYNHFMTELPDVQSLASCEEEHLMKLWQGLGYYSRARNLQKAAKRICTDYHGEFPSNYSAIRSLPGIGDYTAGAISSIAFGLPEPAVDGNVLRVVTRLLCDYSDITKPDTKRSIQTQLKEVMPLQSAGAFNQALMELGALVCLPNGAPLCDQCPLSHLCLAFQQEKTADLPVKPQKKARRIEQRTVFLIFHDHKIALRRRPEKGLLAGLWEPPHELGTDYPFDLWGITPRSLTEGGKGKHIFTHIEWHMTGVVVEAATDTLPDGWVWATRQELQERYPIPNAFSSFQSKMEAGL